MQTLNPQFNPESYSCLIKSLLALGYCPVDFYEADPGRRHVILRHDIDLSTQAAVQMAELESSIGVTAVYFVLLRTEFYNPWSRQCRTDLNDLCELGHEVGLHLDASIYDEDDKTLQTAAAEECDALEQVLQRPVKTISFHRPAKTLQGKIGLLAGRRHAYEPLFFHQMGYCSDSRGGWHHGHPLEHEAVRKNRALQLLTHPIWWQDPAMPTKARLHALLHEKHVKLDRELAKNCTSHQSIFTDPDAQ